MIRSSVHCKSTRRSMTLSPYRLHTIRNECVNRSGEGKTTVLKKPQHKGCQFSPGSLTPSV
jgi:hypothetical protein